MTDITLDAVGVGTEANDGTGDTARAAFTKVNANEALLQNQWKGGTELSFQSTGINDKATSESQRILDGGTQYGNGGVNYELSGRSLTGILKLLATGTAGAGINLYTSSHGTQPSDIELLVANSVQVLVRDGYLRLGDSAAASTFSLLNSVDDGLMILSGGTTSADGLALYMYGDNHATQANDFEVHAQGTGLEMRFDHSASTWDFQANQIILDNSFKIKERSAAPADEAAYGQIWVSDDTPNVLMYTDDAGSDFQISGIPLAKSYTFAARSTSSGVYYQAGFYEASAADANLTNASLTVTLGGATDPHAAHAFIVSGGNGTTDGSDLVVTVSGTSIDESGTRTTSDSEVIEATAGTSALDSYYETSKKWLGTVTFTLSSAGGITFNYDFNYGLAKYEDFGNRDFTVAGFESVGLANVNDTGFSVALCHHKATGWTYHATAFVAGTGEVLDMATDYSTESDLSAGDPFAYKRTGIGLNVLGSASEGVIVMVTTSVNNSVSYMDTHIGVVI